MAMAISKLQFNTTKRIFIYGGFQYKFYVFFFICVWQPNPRVPTVLLWTRTVSPGSILTIRSDPDSCVTTVCRSATSVSSVTNISVNRLLSTADNSLFPISVGGFIAAKIRKLACRSMGFQGAKIYHPRPLPTLAASLE